MDSTFEIRILKQHWIKDDGLEDRNDLCSHARIYVKIGNETLSDIDTAGWCTTAAGLHLMRTLYSNYTPGDFDAQLIPCCGHFMYFNEDGSRVEIGGCPSGIDWNVNHYNYDIELTTKNGNSIKIDFYTYKNVILNFVAEVEAFYGNPNKKIKPDNDFERDTFEMFWIEWNSLKNDIIIK